MKQQERQKMCPNCDGRIPHDSVQCPFCFAQLQLDAPSKTAEPFSALYPPPYSSGPEAKVNLKSAPLEETPVESVPFWSILMLALGSNLLTLGILQFFFSDHGVLRLEMNASYWFLMVLMAVPLVYFGLKNLSSKK